MPRHPPQGDGPIYTRVWMAAADASDAQNQFSAGLDLNAFVQVANTNHAKGLALSTCAPMSRPVRANGSACGADSDANYFTVGLSATQLNTLATTRHG